MTTELTAPRTFPAKADASVLAAHLFADLVARNGLDTYTRGRFTVTEHDGITYATVTPTSDLSPEGWATAFEAATGHPWNPQTPADTTCIDPDNDPGHFDPEAADREAAREQWERMGGADRG